MREPEHRFAILGGTTGPSARPLVLDGGRHAWMRAAGRALGITLYACAACFLWVLMSHFEIEKAGLLVAGMMLVTLSFGAWLSCFYLEGVGAWIGYVVALCTLVAAVVVLGGTVSPT